MRDFIIVGRGLAANVLAHAFYQAGISFYLTGDTTLSSCSKVAAGIWNPLVFKRMTESWMANELVPELLRFYGICEKTMGKEFVTVRTLIKPFTEDHEKELWVKKAGLHQSKNFGEIKEDAGELPGFKIDNGYATVPSGNLNVRQFLESSSQFFKDHLTESVFNYQDLDISPDSIRYKNLYSKNIIFAEGHLVKNNPYFNWVPLVPAKGEIITISSEKIVLRNSVFNRNGFLMDVNEQEFMAGSTYEWKDLNEDATVKGLDELCAKVKAMTGLPFQVIKHEAGIRPSSADRRPLIGSHPHHSNLFLFNGLGTKGVMLAPYFARNFVLFYLKKKNLHPEVNVERFYSRYER